eukprot:gene8952-9877_t
MQVFIVLAILFLFAGHVVEAFRPLMNKKTFSSRLMYSVRIVNNKKKSDVTIEVPPGKIILDVAESQTTSVPYSCRAGSCSTCIGKLKSGTVDQSGQIFLNDKQIEQGYVLTCVAVPTSNVEVEVDVEDTFYNENPDFSA